MLTLVKTLKTLGLSDRMDWTMVKNRVVGVHQFDETTMGMSFRLQGYGNTRVYSINHSQSVVFATIHDPPLPVETVDECTEDGLLDNIIKSSGINKLGTSHRVRAVQTFNNYFVFEMKTENGNKEINILLLEYRLRTKGIKTIMDFDIHDALVVKMDGVKWHFFNSKRIIAIVGSKSLRESTRIVNESWNLILE